MSRENIPPLTPSGAFFQHRARPLERASPCLVSPREAASYLSSPVVPFLFRDGAIRFMKQTSDTGYPHLSGNAWSYRRLVAYRFFRLSEGHRVVPETRCPQAHTALTFLLILSLEPSVSRTRWPNHQRVVLRGCNGIPRDAQAASCFNCLASKLTSFFQTIKVIAAIFLAKVRRAIVGFFPLASKAS